MRVFILDFDGTLGDTTNIIVETMMQTIDALQLPKRTREQCTAMIGLPLKKTFTELYKDFDSTVVDDDMGERCAETYRRLFDQNNTPGAVPLFPKVRETLLELHRRGAMLTIASSRSSDTLNGYMKSLHLDDIITYIVAADNVTNAKPHAEPVLKTIAENNLLPDDCIVVGDTSFDILMAHNAGVKAVGVTYGNGKREDLETVNAEYIIDDFSKLLELC
ncbi:MAG: HAD family hydrolase [Prevotella sp.]|uniref:HAD family hydrolase n=1 Tax=Prevotella sp. TaxID=59823 RepID=UPI002A33C4EF|nr:HAD family hydrolase [Prevotella sp.]MDD7317684.1 HAD family hydrolase [Prevotellaceae bacterium]MDY4020469.1 HAD family hydrolase [Prevotella sp.]